jgi:hypothetical protein
LNSRHIAEIPAYTPSVRGANAMDIRKESRAAFPHRHQVPNWEMAIQTATEPPITSSFSLKGNGTVGSFQQICRSDPLIQR